MTKLIIMSRFIVFFSGQVPARLVLYLLSWSGFLVSFMMRTDINLAIVAMVEDPKIDENTTITENFCYAPQNGAEQQITTTTRADYGGTLQWSADIQSYVLASFYWAYIISQIVGGLATQKLGTKRVFGYAQLATAICSLFIPSAAETHYGIVIFLRSVQGFASVSHLRKVLVFSVGYIIKCVIYRV